MTSPHNKPLSLLKWLLVVVVFVLDLFTPANVIVPFLYMSVLLLCLGHDERRRRMMWGMALTSVALTLLAGVMGAPPTTGSAHSVMWMNRALVSMGIFAAALIIDKRQQTDYELREAIRARDIFLVTLAHELRNPLASLHSGVAVMRRTGVNVPGNLLEIMDRQANHLVRLVDDLLELSRIRDGKILLRLKRVDLTQILQSALEANKPSVEQADQSVVFTTEPETPTIQADLIRISQVFTTLLDNASRSAPTGGCIDVSIKRQGDYLVTTVRDDGCGISPEALPTIFEIFRQAEDYPMHPIGLAGLALVKQIVELHQGTVEAHSDGADKGSEFVVSLPIA